MKITGRKDALILLLGDILALVLAVWATLFVRYGALPSAEDFLSHLVPFSFIFAIWLLVFFIADLYRRQTSLLKSQLPSRLFNAQLINSFIAVTFFYLIPYFGITPKITLFLYLAISFLFIFIWRRFISGGIVLNRRERIIFACEGSLVDEVASELRRNKQYNVEVITGRKPDPSRDRGSLIVFDQRQESADSLQGNFYSFLLAGCRLINIVQLYEEIFDRIPVELVGEGWLVENVSNRPKPVYAITKRAFDLIISLILGVISLPIYPLIYLAIKLSDGGTLFFVDRRVGLGGTPFSIYKFRSMNQAGDRVTTLGRFLRKTRLDELPQLWSVVRGKQSLVGPRPERPDYVEQYREEIPYYDIRHLITPGLSGWAQIYHDNHPHFKPMKEATTEKLSYDLFYVKNRSIWLDLTIALRTISTLLSVKGK